MGILVTGATGNIGRRVVDHLLARGADDVRALTVDPQRAALPDGVTVVRGSVRRPESLVAGLDGVDRVYLAPHPPTVVEVVAVLRDAGVRRVVDLSGEPESWWGSVSGAVEAGVPEWTHLWPADFMENVRIWFPQIRATGEVREPWPDLASTPTAMDDIAEVAAAILLGEGHAGCAYSLTGPTAVSRTQMVETLTAATGVPIRFVTVDPDDAVRALDPERGEMARFSVDQVLTALADGEPEPNTLVADLTGRPATTFAAWAAAHAAELRAELTAA